MVSSVGTAAQVHPHRGIMNAAELQRLHGAELARAPFSDAESWYQLRKILKDHGISISQQAARTWWQSHRQAA